MNKLVVASALALSVAVTSPAFAQETNFSGFTATALAGLDVVVAGDDEDSEGEAGIAYGGAIGYDLNLGSVVIGAEAELMGASTKRRENDGVDFAELKMGRDIYVGARIGAPVTENVLVYAKAGYTNAKLKLTAGDNTGSLSVSDEVDGFRLGAGVEVAMNKLFGRLEYRYSDYGNVVFQGLDTETQAKRHQVLVGIGYRF